MSVNMRHIFVVSSKLTVKRKVYLYSTTIGFLDPNSSDLLCQSQKHVLPRHTHGMSNKQFVYADCYGWDESGTSFESNRYGTYRSQYLGHK